MAQLSQIRRQMQIVTADGRSLGRIELADNPYAIRVVGLPGPLCLNWIARVDRNEVYLSKTQRQIMTACGNAQPRQVMREELV